MTIEWEPSITAWSANVGSLKHLWLRINQDCNDYNWEWDIVNESMQDRDATEYRERRGIIAAGTGISDDHCKQQIADYLETNKYSGKLRPACADKLCSSVASVYLKGEYYCNSHRPK